MDLDCELHEEEVSTEGGHEMKAAAVQFEPVFGDVRGNAHRLLELVASVEADLFVMPELALSGYLFESTDEAAGLAQTPNGREFDGLADLARGKDAVVILGFAERAAEGLYNSSLLLAPDGRREVYRKIQLFNTEKEIFLPGNRPPAVVDTEHGRLGMMICFDWIFPEVARSLALLGADILCHSTNLVLPYCQDAMVTRCIENRVFAITANRVGTENRAGAELTFTGQSEIVTPRGRILERAGVTGECVLVQEIDPTEARDKRITPRNDIRVDRRTDLYRLD
jgi:predicted amidohydrolase